LPGRVSRVDGKKTAGHVYDYRDQFNRGLAGNAKSRSKNYAQHGWTQEFPEEDAALKLLVARQNETSHRMRRRA
jgi:hypothetical protein